MEKDTKAGSGRMSHEAFRQLLQDQSRGFNRMLWWSSAAIGFLMLLLPAYGSGLGTACVVAAVASAALAMTGYSQWRSADACARAEIRAAHALAARALMAHLRA